MKSHKDPDYQKYMRSPEWQSKRLEAMQIHGTKCKKCGSNKGGSIDIHHLTYANFKNENTASELIPLCRKCHEALHRACRKYRKNKYIDLRIFSENFITGQTPSSAASRNPKKNKRQSKKRNKGKYSQNKNKRYFSYTGRRQNKKKMPVKTTPIYNINELLYLVSQMRYAQDNVEYKHLLIFIIKRLNGRNEPEINRDLELARYQNSDQSIEDLLHNNKHKVEFDKFFSYSLNLDRAGFPLSNIKPKDKVVDIANKLVAQNNVQDTLDDMNIRESLFSVKRTERRKSKSKRRSYPSPKPAKSNNLKKPNKPDLSHYQKMLQNLEKELDKLSEMRIIDNER